MYIPKEFPRSLNNFPPNLMLHLADSYSIKQLMLLNIFRDLGNSFGIYMGSREIVAPEGLNNLFNPLTLTPFATFSTLLLVAMNELNIIQYLPSILFVLSSSMSLISDKFVKGNIIKKGAM